MQNRNASSRPGVRAVRLDDLLSGRDASRRVPIQQRAKAISSRTQAAQRTMATLARDRQALATPTASTAAVAARPKAAAPSLATLHLPPDKVDVVAILHALRTDVTVDQRQSPRSTTAPHTAVAAAPPFYRPGQEAPRDPDYVPATVTAMPTTVTLPAASADETPMSPSAPKAIPFTPAGAAPIASTPASSRVTGSGVPQRALLLAILLIGAIFLFILLIARFHTARAADTIITTSHETLSVPGSGFVGGRLLPHPPKTQGAIGVWDQPFEAGRLLCRLPYGTAVLLLEARVAVDERQAIRIQDRGCTGWVRAELITSMSQTPGRVIENNDIWQPGK